MYTINVYASQPESSFLFRQNVKGQFRFAAPGKT